MKALGLFPTKRLNPVAGTSEPERSKCFKKLEQMFPTKRLNPVAGTLDGDKEFCCFKGFPTKRLNPVAGT